MILHEVWNVYNSQKVPYSKLNKKAKTKERGEFQITEIKMISRKDSRMAKQKLQKCWGK